MKKNVALFIKGLPYGGAERVVQRLSFILKDNFNLYILVFDSKISEYDCGCQVINMAIPANNSKIKKMITIFKRMIKLNKIVKEYNFDVVVSFLDGANIVNLLSKSNHKKIISIRNFKKSERRLSIVSRLSDYFIKILYYRADAIVAVSKLIEQSLVEDYKVDPAKISVIYNPYDVDEISQLAAEELESNYEHFFENSKVIITVGRKFHQKGFWHLIKAFSLVKEKETEAKLVIVGDGVQDVQIKKLISDLNLEDSVLLTGHQVNPFKFISRSHVYTMTSLFEGFPNSLVEAMACGKPVISTDCKSGPREILYKFSNIHQVANDIEYADYGILVPPLTESENWEACKIENCEIVLSQVILKVLSDKDCQDQYNKRAFERAKEFDYERCKKAFVDVIQS